MHLTAQPLIPEGHVDEEEGRAQPRRQPWWRPEKKKYWTTTLDEFYFHLLSLSAVRLLAAIIVASMCAGILSRVPDTPVIGIMAYSLAHSAVHFHLFAPKIRSPTVALPTKWFIARLSFYTVGWVIVPILLFFLVGQEDREQTFHSRFQKRNRPRVKGLSGPPALAGARLLRVLTSIAAGFALLALVMCLAQWFVIWKMSNRDWPAREIEEEYRNQKSRTWSKKSSSSG